MPVLLQDPLSEGSDTRHSSMCGPGLMLLRSSVAAAGEIASRTLS